MSTPGGPWQMHCYRIVAVLLAGDVQAGVVMLANGQHGIRLYNEARDVRIVWGVKDDEVEPVGRWGWTMVRPDGSTEAYMTPLTEMAFPEEVAATIVTAFEVSQMDPEGEVEDTPL